MADNQSIFDTTGSVNIFRGIKDGELSSFPINIQIRELISGVVASMCFLAFRFLARFAEWLQSRSVPRKIGKIGVADKRAVELDTVAAEVQHNPNDHRKTAGALDTVVQSGHQKTVEPQMTGIDRQIVRMTEIVGHRRFVGAQLGKDG